MHTNESFEFRIGGFALRGAVGGAVSVIAQPGLQLSAEQALVLARVLHAVASPPLTVAQLDAAALAALERLVGGKSDQTASGTGASASDQGAPATASVPTGAATAVSQAADARVEPAPAARRVFAFARNVIPHTSDEAALALAARAQSGSNDTEGPTDKRLILPAREAVVTQVAGGQTTRKLRETVSLPESRRDSEPRVRREVARDAAHAEQLLLGHKQAKPDKRLVYPIGPIDAAALLSTVARATGKRLVRPTPARVESARPHRSEPAAPPLQAVARPAVATAPAKPTTPAQAAPATDPQVASRASRPASAHSSATTPARTHEAAPAKAVPPQRPNQAVVSSGSKPVPVLRSSAPPAKPKGGIMDRYDEWMRENPGQHAREQLVDVGIRMGWLPRDDAHRVFNVAMHQQRAREMFMILRDGGNETFMRREEATRPTSSGPGKIVRRPAAQVAARRQEAP